MKNSNTNSIEGIARKRSGVRPDHIVLGEDTEEASHTILVVQNGGLVQQFDLDGHSVDEDPVEPLARTIETRVSA
ncbi:hypothetical protein RBH26_06450 [Natronolimnohabitans sp. A-GB9]|uniref:hypothetical protein n=1 Tax=Natronolimnohabitans sp. A-GB9 TaxID=3069757 RepID=UPI0027B13B96|nr:hypothetical protein [Natronolimnohabitans sp. A-GB9]MDQ2050121.1 hypothetical protein [Natronolimnohabitans sp. A-GB9]